MEGFLFNYCPWLHRVWLILCWLFAIVQDQVNPTYDAMFVPPSLWPGWDWAQMNAIYSSRTSPWNTYRVFCSPPDPDEFFDDDYDEDEF